MLISNSDEARCDSLRTMRDGLLKSIVWGETASHTSRYCQLESFLHLTHLGLVWPIQCVRSVVTHRIEKPVTSLLATGDVRGNENPLLVAFHALFVREHNRLAKQVGREELLDLFIL